MPKTTRPLVMLRPLAPEPRPTDDVRRPRNMQPPLVSARGVEQAYDAADSYIRSMLGHVRALFERHKFLSAANDWLNELEGILDDIRASYRAGELPISRVAPGNEHYDSLMQTLNSRHWESKLVPQPGPYEEKDEFIYQTVDYWLSELQSQSFAFLSFLDGGVPASSALDSLEHASRVGYPATTY